ncbi:hypothetical protein K438DRAFT_2114049, partial [Mycena galopus ATCC 62051]
KKGKLSIYNRARLTKSPETFLFVPQCYLWPDHFLSFHNPAFIHFMSGFTRLRLRGLHWISFPLHHGGAKVEAHTANTLPEPEDSGSEPPSPSDSDSTGESSSNSGSFQFVPNPRAAGERELFEETAMYSPRSELDYSPVGTLAMRPIRPLLAPPPPPVGETSPNAEVQIRPDAHGRLKVHSPDERGLQVSYTGRDNINRVNNFYVEDAGHDANFDPHLVDLRTLLEHRPNLLRIICVAIAFCEPPSVHRISGPVGLSLEEVRESTNDIAKYLHKSAVDFAGGVKLPEPFISTMHRNCLQTVGRAHAHIACWCLQSAMQAPRDIPYALEYWAWHVSQATPSRELLRALQDFPFVLSTITEEQLSDVIHWLDCQNDLTDVTHLVSQYQTRLEDLLEINRGKTAGSGV